MQLITMQTKQFSQSELLPVPGEHFGNDYQASVIVYWLFGDQRREGILDLITQILSKYEKIIGNLHIQMIN